jgi:hypothetical protein
LPNGQIIQREVEDHGAAVAVLAFDPARKTAILVSRLSNIDYYFPCE